MPAIRSQTTIRTRRSSGFRRTALMTGSGTVIVDEMRTFSEVSVAQMRTEFEQFPHLPSPGSEVSAAHPRSVHSRRHVGAVRASQTLRCVVSITDATMGHCRLHQFVLRRVLCNRVQHHSSNRLTVYHDQVMEGVLLFKSIVDVNESFQ